MTWIVLAAGLGANFIVFALLFRRLRQLSWQLRDMRAERNSEWILRALRDVPEQEQAVQAANGAGFEPPPVGPQPVRRKRHLGLYIGGLSAAGAALSELTRRAWQTDRGQLIAAGAALIATTAVVLAVLQWQEDTANEPPSSAPTATATVTIAPTSTPAPTPSAGPSTTPGAPDTISPSRRGPDSGSPTPVESVSGAPIDGGTPPTASAPSDTALSEGGAESSPPTGGPSPSPGTPSPTEPPAQSTPPPSPGTSGLCLGLVLWPVLDLAACLAGGG